MILHRSPSTFFIYLFFGLICEKFLRIASQKIINRLPVVSDYSCNPCSTPIDNITIWLLFSNSPCFHPGQALLLWNTTKCTSPENLNSEDISFDRNIVFVKKRICFYSYNLLINYQYSCSSDHPIRHGQFYVAHPRYSNARRSKRWLIRRTTSITKIHFQQERYFIELPEDMAINSLLLIVQATHINNRSLFYSMIAPEDSRSINVFMLNTITGEIRCVILSYELFQNFTLYFAI